MLGNPNRKTASGRKKMQSQIKMLTIPKTECCGFILGQRHPRCPEVNPVAFVLYSRIRIRFQGQSMVYEYEAPAPDFSRIDEANWAHAAIERPRAGDGNRLPRFV